MEYLPFVSFRRSILVILATVGLPILVPSLWAQQDHAAAGSPEAAWSTIQQLVQNLESAVESKNLHGIHEPSMKIRAPIRALKQHSSILSADTSKKKMPGLKKLKNSKTILNSAADKGNKKKVKPALKKFK